MGIIQDVGSCCGLETFIIEIRERLSEPEILEILDARRESQRDDIRLVAEAFRPV